MSSVNKFIGIGNVTRDIEIRYGKSGKAVASFSIACNETWKKDGVKQEKVEFINVAAFGKLAEIIGEYVKKGQQIYIEGKFTTDCYEKDGEKRYSSKIIANQMTMLGQTGGGPQENSSQQNSLECPRCKKTPCRCGTEKQNDDFEDEDIPF